MSDDPALVAGSAPANHSSGYEILVRPDVATSNALFDILADWEDQLKHCEGIEDALKKAESLAHDVPEVSP